MLLKITGLTKAFGQGAHRTDVLRDVDLCLAAGERIALTGESGSGKSTLLHIIAGLEEADRGHVELGGQDITALSDQARAQVRREVIGLVFQQFNLIPALDVRANMAFQARLAGRADPDWLAHLTAKLGLTEKLNDYPELLSGGQQQRVAVARALAPRPRLVLADEPTGNLDQETGDQVLDLMQELVEDAGAGLMVVTHSERVAERLDRRYVLRQGRLT